MKRIFFFLAAAAALASCVKEENTYTPEQDTDRVVTIKAVAGDTKTVLDDDKTSVVWEDKDEIAVVVKGADNYLETFKTSLTEKNSTAEFTGVLSEAMYEDNTVTGTGYAVYPKSAVTSDNGVIAIAHELLEVQDGTIATGENLSYAMVQAGDIKTGEAEVTFQNALTLLKLIVPAGVKSVNITASASSSDLVGKAAFTASTYTATEDNAQVDKISFVKTGTTGKRSVTLSNNDEELAAGEHHLLVYPGTAYELTLTMTGMDDAVYTNTITGSAIAGTTLTGIKFEPGTYRTINLTKLFKMDVDAAENVSPMGGTFEFDVVAAEQYDYKVAIEGNPTWITLNENAHVTKAFAGTKVSFDIQPNTSGESRQANVTITWGTDGVKNFTITQPSASLDFVYVDPTDPESGLLQWQETFDLYETYANAVAKSDPVKTYNTNVFTISLSEGAEIEYGIYKIENIFYANRQTQGAKGGTYYADYSDGILTIKTSEQNGAVRSYYFNNDIELAYDNATKTFSLATPVGYAYDSFNGDLKEGYVGNYSVEVKETDSDTESGDITGNYSATGKFGSSSAYTSSAFSDSFKIETNGDAKGQYKITGMFNVYGGGGGTYYANFADNILTILAENSKHDTYMGAGSLVNDITMTYSDGKFTISESILISNTYGSLYVGQDYTAIKQ